MNNVDNYKIMIRLRKQAEVDVIPEPKEIFDKSISCWFQYTNFK